MIAKNNFLIKKWFSNENEALVAFYQKKLTIHTPILVRYSVLNFKIKNENGKLKFFDTLTNLSSNEKEIKIYKIIEINKKINNFYLLTNIGIIIAHSFGNNNYEITNLFLETTPGRLLFSLNFNSILKT